MEMITETLDIREAEYARLLAEALPKPIQNDAEHARITQKLLDFDERDDLTPEEAALAEVLTLLVVDYEQKHHALPEVPPAEALKALMDERGLKHKDIWPVIGNKGATTEILSGRRSISKAQARRLANHLRVPIDLFV
jgi:HTH-type transcriptional regulator/antitoxin HigA